MDVVGLFANWENTCFSASGFGGSGAAIVSTAAPQLEQQRHSTVPKVAAAAAAGGSVISQLGRGRSDTSISKEQLQSARYIGQFERKVLMCSLPASTDASAGAGAGAEPLLVAVDQHAAGERVQLEQLEDGVYSIHTGLAPVANAASSSHVSTVATVAMWSFDSAERLALISKQPSLQRWGFEMQLLAGDGSGSAERCVVSVSRVPVIAGVTLGQGHCRKLLLDAEAARPAIVQALLASRACRAAVRFGDTVAPEQARELLAQLAACRLPFQCAHGRPTLYPLLELQGTREGS